METLFNVFHLDVTNLRLAVHVSFGDTFHRVPTFGTVPAHRRIPCMAHSFSDIGVADETQHRPHLTTHVGSLPRPADLADAILARENGTLDAAGRQHLPAKIAAAVAEVVHTQLDTGIDVVSDGEMSKIGYATYVKERLTGFEDAETPEGGGLSIADLDDYPGMAETSLAGLTTATPTCTGEVTYTGHADLRTDIDNFRAALGTGTDPDAGVERFALAEAMREEYRAITDAGLVLQIDPPLDPPDHAMCGGRGTTAPHVAPAGRRTRPCDHVPVTTAASDDPAGSVVAHIRARMPALTDRGRRIGQSILDNPLDVIHLTVTDLAQRTHTSVATVVRFCQDVGLRGFADLKIRLAAETIPAERGLHEDVAVDDPAPTILSKVLTSTAGAVAAAADTVSATAFTHAVDLLRGADHLLCIGVGTSAPLAQDAGYRFRTAGLPAEAPYDPHVQHVAARLLGPGAVCLCISHTGQTRESLDSARAAKAAGAATVAITSFFNSPLTELVDVALVAGSRETDFRVEAITSRIAHIAVLDALYVAVFLSDIDRARTAQQLSAAALTEHRI